MAQNKANGPGNHVLAGGLQWRCYNAIEIAIDRGNMIRCHRYDCLLILDRDYNILRWNFRESDLEKELRQMMVVLRERER